MYAIIVFRVIPFEDCSADKHIGYWSLLINMGTCHRLNKALTIGLTALPVILNMIGNACHMASVHWPE